MYLIRKLLRNALGGIIGALIGAAVGIFLIQFSEGQGTIVHSLVQSLTYPSYDLPIVWRDDIPVDDVVIVYLDEESADALKEPLTGIWNRGKTHAALVERLTREKARAVAFDVVFTGYSTNKADDERFIKALEAFPNNILGADETPFAEGRSGQNARSMDVPEDEVLEVVGGLGTVALYPEPDLVVRQHPPYDPKDFFPSLSWATAKLMNAPLLSDTNEVRRERWLNYYGPPGWLPNVSYWRTLAPGELKDGFFFNKVVFVGSRTKTKAAGERKDEYPSPHSSTLKGRFMPGVEIQATMFLNLIRNDAIRRMHWNQELSFIILFGAVFGVGLAQLRPLFATGLSLAGIAITFVIGYVMVAQTGLWFAWTIIIAQIVATMVWSVIFNSWKSLLQTRLLTQSLAMYVSPSQAKRIAKRPDMLQPGAVKQEISILFSDIANFTTMSEGMDPDELAALMNGYFESAVTKCIYATEGTVVKFIGDAIFAIWNAPDPQVDHRERACRGAILLRDQVTDFPLPKNKPDLEVRTRIGLHCGEASVGNFGSKARVDYTAFGENVNMSARMEGLNKYLGTSILATGDIMRPVENLFITRYLGQFQLKGFNKGIEVFELIDVPENVERSRAYREIFARGLEAFRRQRWDDAIAAFNEVLEIKPKDGPAKYYLKQVAELRHESLEPDWDGTIELAEK